ncbi:MAG: tetratricopeptide repeat protein [Nitrospinaceae bacterium]|nr:MAG: tetratricopeptide repeat protein [Nitrospinaceae bacterium]
MSSKKNTRKSSPHASTAPSKASLLKRSAGALGLTALALFGLWALMYFSTTPGKLVPYDGAKETAAAGAKENGPSDASAERLKNDPGRALKERVKKVQGDPAPLLSREALEHIQKGMQFTEQGKFNQGDMEFKKAAELSPNSPELFSIWGAALRMQKKFAAANKKFARAHELSPKDEEITFNWGLSLLEEDNPDEAIRLFTKTTELAPDNFLAYNYLGKSYGRKKMYAEEQASYRKAIEINPEFARSHFNLGIVLSLQKKFEEAAPHFEKAIEIDKSFEKPFVVQMLTALGRYNSSGKKPQESAEPVQEAKAAPAPPANEEKPKEATKPAEEKKSEGSDHKMEGSKNSKETTSLRGRVRVNGKPLSELAVLFLETKSKLRVPGQTVTDLTIHQSELQFLPRHTVVPVGSTVTFMNDDREVHNIFSRSQGNQFNLGAMAGGTGKSIKFTQAGPVVLRCNLHKEMTGTVFVVPNGYHTHPDADGNYAFNNIKSQGYLLQVWAPRLLPEEVAANLKPIDLTGEDQTIDFDLTSASKPGEIHDMVDPTDYNLIVDNIEKEIFQAIEDWKNKKKFISQKRMLMAITKHYDGEGLKGAVAKSFSEKRSLILEKRMDALRKQIANIGGAGKDTTEDSLKSEAKAIVTRLRGTVQELEARLNPDSAKK